MKTVIKYVSIISLSAIFFITLAIAPEIFSQSTTDSVIPVPAASMGSSIHNISIQWPQIESATGYEIYRSDNINQNGELIATTNETLYADATVDPGYLYYYRVKAVTVQNVSGFSKPASGYRRMDLTRKYNLDTLLNSYTNKPPSPSAADRKRLSVLSQYYDGWFRLKFIMFYGKPYVRRGTVIVLADCKNYTIDAENKTVWFKSPENDYRMYFNVPKLFRVINKANDAELGRILLNNALIFAIRRRDTKITESNGRIKFIPELEALGMASQYYYRTTNWTSGTIMFGTGNDKLMSEMRKIEKQKK